MPIVEIQVAEAKLPARTAAMRTWLYKKKRNPLRFETRPGPPGTMIVQIELREPNLADALRRTFDPLGTQGHCHVKQL